MRKERVVNIKELQKSPSRHLRGITRILRGKSTLGYFLAEGDFSDLIEDMEAMNSPNYLNSILKARRNRTLTSLTQIEKKYGI